MQAYIGKRVLLFFPTLILVTIIVFTLLRVVPGDPALLLLGGGTEGASYTQEDLDRLRATLGTDRHPIVQYGDWFLNMWRLDFGNSFYFQSGQHKVDAPVFGFIADRFPITLELTLIALLMASLVAIPLGVVSAFKQDSISDYAARIITITGIAIPNFWLAIIMLLFLAIIFDWIPPSGLRPNLGRSGKKPAARWSFPHWPWVSVIWLS